MSNLAISPNINPLSNHTSVNRTATPLDPQKYLSKELEDEKIIQALNSSEGLHEPVHTPNPIIQTEAISTEAPQPKLFRDLAPIYAYSAACTLHLLAWLSRITNVIPKPIGKFLDENAQKFSKTVNCLNYGGKAVTAYKANNSLDSISKALLPIVIPWISLENTFLAVGLISGTTMLSTAHNPRISDNKSFFGNLQEHFKIYKEMGKELLAKDGWRKLFDSGDTHLMFLGGNMNLFGGLLGIAMDRGNKTLKAAGSFVRNIGGAVCDVAKILHGDINYVISGALYIITHVLDIVQSMSGKERARTISHFVQGISCVANYFYTQPTNTMADHTFKDRFKEARLKLVPQAMPA